MLKLLEPIHGSLDNVLAASGKMELLGLDNTFLGKGDIKDWSLELKSRIKTDGD